MPRSVVHILLAYWGIISVMGVNCHIPYSSMEKLYGDLLSSYNTRIRPIQDQNSTLVLQAYFKPLALYSLDTANQMMSILGSFYLQWNDEFLQWNTTDYDGIGIVKLNIADVWHPVMLLSPTFHDHQVVGFKEDEVTVTSGGRVYWGTYDVYTVICGIHTTYYPFDTQECRINLYTNKLSDEVLLQPLGDGFEARFIYENVEWDSLDSRMEIYIEDTYKMQQLQYRFLFTRRPSFIMYTTVGPIVLLAFLNSFVFLVPIVSGEKGSIAITVLLSFSVYISSVSSALPSNSLHSPLLFIVITTLEIHSAIIVLVVIAESRIYHTANGQTCFQQLFGSRCSGHRSTDEDGTIDNDRSLNLKREDNASDSDNKHLFKKFDLVLFGISLVVNIVTVSVFAFKLYKGLRNTL